VWCVVCVICRCVGVWSVWFVRGMLVRVVVFIMRHPHEGHSPSFFPHNHTSNRGINPSLFLVSVFVFVFVSISNHVRHCLRQST